MLNQRNLDSIYFCHYQTIDLFRKGMNKYENQKECYTFAPSYLKQ
jgi:hypothetical protein